MLEADKTSLIDPDRTGGSHPKAAKQQLHQGATCLITYSCFGLTKKNETGRRESF